MTQIGDPGKSTAVLKNTVIGLFAIAVFLGLQCALLFTLNLWNNSQQVVGTKEHVILLSSENRVEAVAKIDTGADLSAIDAGLVNTLGLQPDTTNTRIIRTTSGTEERPTVKIDFVLSDRTVSSVFTVADRSGFETPLIIGSPDVAGFVVDPSAEFLTTPETGAISPLSLFRISGFSPAWQLQRVIMVIPILATIVVLLRLLVGIRTYGIFASVIIALSFIDLGLITGLIVFTLLLIIGIGFNTICLTRLKLPHIASLALTVFVLVATLLAISMLPYGYPLSFANVFFPLFVTTYAVEQATRIMDEQGVARVFPITLATIVAAIGLAVIGNLLMQQPLITIAVIFVFSCALTIAAGNYLGLRLNEIIRFKFLRRSYVHK